MLQDYVKKLQYLTGINDLKFKIVLTSHLVLWPRAQVHKAQVSGSLSVSFCMVSPNISSIIIRVFCPYVNKCVSVHMHWVENARLQ
jgi:hypothetical protein